MTTLYRIVYFESQSSSPSQWQHTTLYSVGHSVHIKELYEKLKILLKAINYDKFKWQICSDLKVIAMLVGLQKCSHNIASSFVNGTAELGLFITQEMIVLPKNFWN